MIAGVNYSDYLFWNPTVQQWQVGDQTVHLGAHAGEVGQSASGPIAIGENAGRQSQGDYAVALGAGAGLQTQQRDAVAIGHNAGQTQQSIEAIAMGHNAAFNGQKFQAIAIGNSAGNQNQDRSAVAIGSNAGQIAQGINAIAIGTQAGQGTAFPNTSQGLEAIAIGLQAGEKAQKTQSVAIGSGAGSNYQETLAVAIGYSAGSANQGIESIAIGAYAGETTQTTKAIAIGYSAGNGNQGSSAIAIGDHAGSLNQGADSIAIGTKAQTSANSILLNASGTSQSTSTAGFFVNPIIGESLDPLPVLRYNAVSKEITYDTNKTFVIDHPTDRDRYLVHACLEGPESGVYYRGEAELTDGETWVELPSYVSQLARNLTVQLTQINSRRDDSFARLRAGHVTAWGFPVYGDACTFAWHVFGTRSDIQTEPLRTDVVVQGDGPYRYIQ